ncbi:MAG TPA: glycosyltransferase family 39 protein [Acidimicrobiales bacterium]|nr:glycosyltransferase family 39 protein [Acidimicrobiales bacterium]
MTTDVLPLEPNVELPVDSLLVPDQRDQRDQPPHYGRVRRLWRGRPGDPPWVRPALLTLLVGTAVLYLWGLGASGWANSFYSAAVQAGTKSWKAFFFGSSDASNFITVDKPPASLWVMEISARLFGVNAWSILVPQALEGVASVAVLYAAVRRSFRPGAALLAGLVLATTPVAALMFRYNNPDALLVLLLTVAAYATVRALERANTWWLVLAMSAVGTGFITKMLQAFLVVPALGLVYLIAAPTPLRRRIVQLAVGAVALVVSAGWWVAAVALTPAADRPYVGGSQDNNILNLIFGYNGLGRISGSESGSVGGAGAAGSRWGPTGWLRFFGSEFGTQISWLIPAALIVALASLWLWRRRPRTDAARSAMLLWSGWLIVTAVVISLAKGIIHPYYSVAAAPAIGAMVGIGASALWEKRSTIVARAALAAALAATAVWSYFLLDRAPTWMPWLRSAVLVVGLGVAVFLIITPRLRGQAALALGVIGVGAALAGPAAYALDTAATAHAGAIPSAGPAATAGPGGAPGGPGGTFGGGPGGAVTRRPGNTGGRFPGGSSTGRGSTLGPGVRSSVGSAVPGGNAATGVPSGSLPSGGSFPPGGFGGPPGARAGANGRLPSFGGRGGGGRAGGGGFLSISTPGTALVRTLESNASAYTWVAATVNSNSAAGYQLATDDPVMAIGGFNGTDPAPTLAQFERYVADKKIHYFVPGGTGPGASTTGTTAGQITQWVESHFTSKTINGVTVYDLTAST